MQPQLQSDLNRLKEMLLTMASHAESALRDAVESLVRRDDDLARAVKERDSTIDQLEKDVDEASVQLLAKAPLAGDLRLILVAMKISRDLERVGDEATTIGRRVLELNNEPPFPADDVDIQGMAERAIAMLRDALDSFVRVDPTRARGVVPRDKEIDRLNKQNHRVLASYIIEAPARTTRCLNLMVISKCLERIGDHAANIAEDVVYLGEAKDIRHAKSKANEEAES